MGELPQNSEIQFVEISFTFQKNQVGGQYSPRSLKLQLNFSSKNSKVVKNDIAMSCLNVGPDEVVGAQKEG